MILLCGLRTDPCLKTVEAHAERLGHPVVWFDQEHWSRTRVAYDLTAAGLTGVVQADGAICDIADTTGIYLRLVDYRKLPALRSSEPGSDLWRSCEVRHEALRALAEVSGARVVSPLRAEGTNFSKPFQTLALSRAGFQVPETLITNRPAEVRRFLNQHPQVIYKSTSAVRSIVQMIDSEAVERLEQVRTCPVQFQVFIPGRDIRVHVVGRQLFATAIDAYTVDYRYAGNEGVSAVLTPFVLDAKLRAAVLDACRHLGLAVAGVDLKLQEDGSVWWLEVNPNPGFSWFEDATQQPIGRAIAEFLCGDL